MNHNKRRQARNSKRKPKRLKKNGIPVQGERPPRKRYFPGEKVDD